MNTKERRLLDARTSGHYDRIVKLLIVGNSGIGKSNLLNRFVDDKYTPDFISTIGIDFKTKFIEIDNKIIKVQMFDVAGAERFITITSTYYRGSHGIILSYAINDLQSFNNVTRWANNVSDNCNHYVDRILIGNKCDLLTERCVEYQQGKDLANKFGIKFYETSAKTGYEVNQGFEFFIKIIKDRLEKEDLENGIETKEARDLPITLLPKTSIEARCC